MNDWNIQGRAHCCQACQKAFADKQPYHTLLFDEKQMYSRLDICEACWQNQYSHGASERKGFVSRWQGVFQAPPPPAPEPIKKENAESLLRKIMEQEDPKYASASYILAVMLERKRLLKVKEQYKREGQRIFLYEQPKTGDMFTIPDPNLQLNQLEQVQHEIASLLEHGLNPSPVQTTEADPNASQTPVAPESGEAPPTNPLASSPETAASSRESAATTPEAPAQNEPSNNPPLST